MNKSVFWFLPMGLLLWFGARYNYLLFHSFVAFWSIGIALLVGYVGLATYRYSRNSLIAGLGILALGMGAVDLLHTLAYEGMGVFPSFTPDQPAQLWLLARWVQSLGFLVVLFYHQRRKFLPTFGGLIFFVVAAGVTCVFLKLFPVCFIQGSGLTPFKIGSEWFISIAFSLGVLVVLRSGNPAIRPYRHVFAAFLLLSVGSEMSLTLYNDIYGVMNMAGLLFKVVSFWVLWVGFLLPAVRDPLLTLFNPIISDRSALLGAMTGPSGILDATGKVLAGNEHFQPVCVGAVEQRLSSVGDLFSEAGKMILSRLDEVVGAQAPLHFEFREKGKDFRAGIYPMPSKRPGDERQYALMSWDVTGEKKVRVELAEARESLLEAQEMALLGTMRVEITSGQVICSKSFRVLFGLSPEAEIDFRWYNSRILDEDRERIDAIRKSTWGFGKDSYRYECRILRVDGVVRNIRAWNRITRDETGQVTELLGTFQDITEQLRLQEELEASEARYRSYIERAPVGVIVADEAGTMVEVNQADSRITGYAREELLGMDIVDLYPPDQREAARERFHRLRSKGTQAFEAHFLRKDGTRGFWKVIAVPMPDATYMGLVQDLSERYEALEKARLSQERFKRLFDTIMEGFGIHEAIVGGRGDLIDYRFLEVNPAFEELTGLAAQSILGKTAREVFNDLEGHWFETYRKVVRTGESVRFRGFAAELGRWYEVLAFPMGENRFGTAFRDVTEEQEQEEALENINCELELHVKELDRAWEQTIRVLADLAEFRDPYTTGHQKRVAELAEAICFEMELEEELTVETVRAALVHDIGKIQVPSDFLSKPGRLSQREFEVIKKHPQVAAHLLKGIDLPWPLGDIVWQHHERLDGSGYPRGLNGDEILFQARIIAVADVVEAMASNRPYRPSLGLTVALEEVEKGAGTKYDAEVVAACIRLFNEKGYKLPE